MCGVDVIGLDRSTMSFGCDEDMDGSETECWKLCCEDVRGVDGSVFVNGGRIGGICGRLIFLFGCRDIIVYVSLWRPSC